MQIPPTADTGSSVAALRKAIDEDDVKTDMNMEESIRLLTCVDHNGTHVVVEKKALDVVTRLAANQLRSINEEMKTIKSGLIHEAVFETIHRFEEAIDAMPYNQ